MSTKTKRLYLYYFSQKVIHFVPSTRLLDIKLAPC